MTSGTIRFRALSSAEDLDLRRREALRAEALRSFADRLQARRRRIVFLREATGDGDGPSSDGTARS